MLGTASIVPSITLAFGAAFLIIIGPRWRALLLVMGCGWPGHPWPWWFVVHAASFGGLVYASTAIYAPGGDLVLASACWVALVVATLGTWLLAVAPAGAWLWLIRREALSVLAAGLAGVGVWAAGKISQVAWQPLAAATFVVVRQFLLLLYPDVSAEPGARVIGTPSFMVAIAPECSGYEGMALITVFLALYVWLFRRRLRFPQALLLFPVGILTIWLANALRITALIAIGTSLSPGVAAGGFHSQAGWIAFLMVAGGMMVASHRTRFLMAEPPQMASTAMPLAAALLVPLLVVLATSLLTSAVSSGFDWLYPLRPLATGAALWLFRSAYRDLFTRTDWLPSIAVGIAVWILWVLLEPAGNHGDGALTGALANLPAEAAAGWLVFRILGAVVTVPLAEELAFRGYLMRKLIAWDFERVRPGELAWGSFILSSVAFGLLHGRWLAGTIAGMGYALALARRGRLGDAVVAHMTTNALIAVQMLMPRG